MSGGDFNWNGLEEADDILLGYQPPTAVYTTSSGGVCVRQQADQTEDYDPLICLTPLGALAVAWRIIELAHAVGVPAPPRELMAQPLDPGPSKPVLASEAPEGTPGPLPVVMEGGKARTAA